MKKIVLAMMILASGLMASSKWTCYRYVYGKPTGGVVYVYADSKIEATDKAMKKYHKLKYRIDSVDCK